MIRVTIDDRAQCIMCGACWAASPEVFETGDDGLSQLVAAYRVAGDPTSGEVPGTLRAAVEEAAASCPVEIIHVS